MKKTILFPIIISAAFAAFADNENYDGQYLKYWDFSGQSLVNSSWVEAFAVGAHFNNANLTSANFTKFWADEATFGGANFTDAVITGASLSETTSGGFTKEQLYSTKNYQNKDLSYVEIASNDLSGWDFSGQNLESAVFSFSRLEDANFANSIITNARLQKTVEKGFTKEQLYSTKSYQDKNLRGVSLWGNDLSGWDFSGQNLEESSFEASNLSGADFSESNLNGALLLETTLADADFTNASITGADLSKTLEFGFTTEQLYSTKSYQDKNLGGIAFSYNYADGWDFSGQNMKRALFSFGYLPNVNFTGANLTGADFTETDLDGANFTGADLRGAYLEQATGTPIYKNTIFTDGAIKNFSMATAGDSLTIGVYETAAKISEADASVSGGATLTLEAGAALEVVDGKTLTISDGGNLVINTDAAGSTLLSAESGAGLAFESGAIMRVNIEGAFDPSETSLLVVMSWGDGARISGLDLFEAGANLFFTINGEAYSGAWDCGISENQFQIVFSEIPEPATYAALFGALALAFAAYRRSAK